MIHTAFPAQPTDKLSAVRTRVLCPRETRAVLCVTTNAHLCYAKMTCALVSGSDELSSNGTLKLAGNPVVERGEATNSVPKGESKLNATVSLKTRAQMRWKHVRRGPRRTTYFAHA